MKTFLTLLATAAALASAPAFATEALAKEKGCMGCHALATKIVGPAYKDVAAKYKDDKGAAARLSAKIIAGGTGVWGQIPMPANPVKKEEADKLAAWVLSVK